MDKCERCILAREEVCSVLRIEIKKCKEIVAKQGCFAFIEKDNED